MKATYKSRLTLSDLETGILQGDRVILGKAITLIESNLEDDQVLGQTLLEKLITHTGKSVRIGITGVPGVGKSTFIEAFGKHITDQGKRLAVLTVDPSSQLTKGSILGDKTRMEELSKNPKAFIRPTASGNVLGGVAGRTREAMLLCEAAGYEVIIVETVGVGQSEVSVKGMVDFFLLLMLAGAGDELQGIKKGIIEVADAIVITKADGDNIKQARQAQAAYQHALHLLSHDSGWDPVVLTSSAMTGDGLPHVWDTITKYIHQSQASGSFEKNRSDQRVSWFREYFNQILTFEMQKYPALLTTSEKLEQAVAELSISPRSAARELLEAYHQAIRGSRS